MALHRPGEDNRSGGWAREEELLNDSLQVINRGGNHLDDNTVGPRHFITFQHFRSRLIERTDDSGGWSCGYENARFVTICLPKEQAQSPVSPPPLDLHLPGPSSKPGLLLAQAPLRVDEVQDLDDQISEIAKAAFGLGLKLSIRIELGSTTPPSEEAVAKINQLLQEVSEQLQLRPS